MGGKELALAAGLLGAIVAGVLTRQQISPRQVREAVQEEEVLTAPRVVVTPQVARPTASEDAERRAPARLVAPPGTAGSGSLEGSGLAVTVLFGAAFQPPGGLFVLVVPQGMPDVR